MISYAVFCLKKKKIRKGHGRSTLNTYKMSRISSVGYPQIYTGGSYPLFLPYRGLLWVLWPQFHNTLYFCEFCDRSTTIPYTSEFCDSCTTIPCTSVSSVTDPGPYRDYRSVLEQIQYPIEISRTLQNLSVVSSHYISLSSFKNPTRYTSILSRTLRTSYRLPLLLLLHTRNIYQVPGIQGIKVQQLCILGS